MKVGIYNFLCIAEILFLVVSAGLKKLQSCFAAFYSVVVVHTQIFSIFNI